MPSSTNHGNNAFSVFIALAVAISMFGTAASARNRNVTVKANKTTTIWQQTAFMVATCSSININDYSLVQPGNGKLHVTKTRLKVPSGKCKGSTMHALLVHYTPKSGFRGKDKGAFKFRYQAHETAGHKRTTTNTFRITVK